MSTITTPMQSATLATLTPTLTDADAAAALLKSGEAELAAFESDEKRGDSRYLRLIRWTRSFLTMNEQSGIPGRAEAAALFKRAGVNFSRVLLLAKIEARLIKPLVKADHERATRLLKTPDGEPIAVNLIAERGDVPYAGPSDVLEQGLATFTSTYKMYKEMYEKGKGGRKVRTLDDAVNGRLRASRNAYTDSETGALMTLAPGNSADHWTRLLLAMLKAPIANAVIRPERREQIATVVGLIMAESPLSAVVDNEGKPLA